MPDLTTHTPSTEIPVVAFPPAREDAAVARARPHVVVPRDNEHCPPRPRLSTQQFDSVRILGSRVHLVKLSEAVALIDQWTSEPLRRCRQVVATGFHGLWQAHQDERLKSILNQAELWVPDGIAPVWAARCRGHRQAERVPGPELLAAVLEQGAQTGLRSFFYGDTTETLSLLTSRIRRRFPGNRIVGAMAPPFRALTREEDHAVLQQINRSRPDILWVALGAPKQEEWIHERLDRLQAKVAIGVGAAFGFLSGHVRRAPRWLGNLGLEWAYRLASEPRKCWRRSLVEGPQFLAHLALELTGIRRYDNECNTRARPR